MKQKEKEESVEDMKNEEKEERTEEVEIKLVKQRWPEWGSALIFFLLAFVVPSSLVNLVIGPLFLKSLAVSYPVFFMILNSILLLSFVAGGVFVSSKLMNKVFILKSKKDFINTALIYVGLFTYYTINSSLSLTKSLLMFTALYFVVAIFLFYLLSLKLLEESGEAEEKDRKKSAIVAFILGIVSLFTFSIVNLNLAIAGIAVLAGYAGLASSKKKWATLGLILSLSSLFLGGIFYARYGEYQKMAVAPGAVSKKISLDKTFEEINLGYAVKYPVSWSQSKSDNVTVIFSSPAEAGSFGSFTNIQNIAHKEKGGNYKNVDEVINDLKKQFKQLDKNASFEKDFDDARTDTTGGKILFGKGFDVVYNYQGKKVKQRQMVFDYAEKGIFYAWSFGSSVERYEADLEITKAMFDSWKIYE